MTVTTHRWMEYEKGMGVVRIRSRPVSESVRESREFNKAAKGDERISVNHLYNHLLVVAASIAFLSCKAEM